MVMRTKHEGLHFNVFNIGTAMKLMEEGKVDKIVIHNNELVEVGNRKVSLFDQDEVADESVKNS